MKSILIQLDTDPHASSFDRVVAVDAGVDQLFSYAGVTPDNVVPLVHGAMFTRGQKDLKGTALFVGGSDVVVGEQILKKIKKTFFGPVRVSVMMDSNGSSTTAAAAVLAAARHVDLKTVDVLVLGATGPVGQRAAQLLAMRGAQVRLGSRSLERAQKVCDVIKKTTPDAQVRPVDTSQADTTGEACQGAGLIIAAGAAGAQFLKSDELFALDGLQVAIDLNAVPPVGLGGIAVTDKAVEHHGVLCYGAVGIGGAKMKIHKAAIRRLFDSNDQILDTAAIYAIGEALGD